MSSKKIIRYLNAAIKECESFQKANRKKKKGGKCPFEQGTEERRNYYAAKDKYHSARAARVRKLSVENRLRELRCFRSAINLLVWVHDITNSSAIEGGLRGITSALGFKRRLE